MNVVQVNIHEAKTTLSALLRRVVEGEEVLIARAGKPVARLVPFRPRQHRVIGMDDGAFVVPDDFDAPLPDEVIRAFEE